MADHCVLLVDELLDQSTLEAAIENRNQLTPRSTLEIETQLSRKKRNACHQSTPGKLVECRICKDDDEDKNMESPCSCRGSLKYAHRKCVQQWCNEKGDTICEICHQPFMPNYTVPPQLFGYGSSIYSRANWDVPQHGLHGPGFATIFDRDHRNFLDLGHDDNLNASSRSLTCCRFVAVIFMILLLLRYLLPIMLTGPDESTYSLLSMWALMTAGVLIPVYIMARLLSTLHFRQQHQGHRGVSLALEEDGW